MNCRACGAIIIVAREIEYNFARRVLRLQATVRAADLSRLFRRERDRVETLDDSYDGILAVLPTKIPRDTASD